MSIMLQQCDIFESFFTPLEQGCVTTSARGGRSDRGTLVLRNASRIGYVDAVACFVGCCHLAVISVVENRHSFVVVGEL